MSDEMRDIGPYHSEEQAQRQYGNWVRGIPGPAKLSTRMMVREALMGVGITPTDFEMDQFVEAALTPVQATILHGWVIKAYLAGTAHRGAPVSSPSEER